MASSVSVLEKIKKFGCAAAVAVVLTGCASAPQQDAGAANDPLEDVNRVIHGFNDMIDTLFLRPAATLYRGLTPPPIQEGIHNMLGNLSTPIILFNDILQGEPERAGDTVARFAINSTAGVLGFLDIASDMGYKKHSEDFGQTLAVWGVGEGPYIVLPIFGPSNPRDIVGRVVDYFTDPVNIWAKNTDKDGFPVARSVISAIDARAYYYDALEDIRNNSLDPYASMRSYYRQLRENEIMNNDAPTVTSAPDLSFDFSTPAPGDEEITEAR